jgi:hypothetical protein
VTQRLALALLAIAAVAWAGGGQAATPAKRKPPPVVRIVEPGALALDYRGGLVVADRKLNRVVRIDLRTGKRRVVAAGLRDIVALTCDDMLRLYVGAADASTESVLAGRSSSQATAGGRTPATAGPQRLPRSPA